MKYNIYWSPHAKESYAAILDQLFQRFSTDTVLAIDDKMEKLLEALFKFKFKLPNLSKKINNSRIKQILIK